jgi:cyclophilin family peptidyl-prolyl cis-trans isomerase/HEAT repeat protein
VGTRRTRIAAASLVASLAACGCGREPAEPAPGQDSTRTTRQRIVALEAARNFGGGELERGLAHPDARVRRAAAMALGRIQDPAALRPLLARLVDRDSAVAVAAAFAISQLQGLDDPSRHALQEALVPLVELRIEPRVFPDLEALAKQGGPEIVPIITAHLATGVLAGEGSEARSPLVEGAAAWGLARIKTATALKMLSQVSDLRNRAPRAACWIAAAMAVAPDSSFRRPLLSLLAHADATARAAGARALGKQRDPGAIAALVPTLSDFDWRVRASALLAIAELGDARRNDGQAREFCAAMLSDAHPLVREAAAGALDSLGLGGHAPLLRAALVDPVPAVRLAALRCAARWRAPEARDAWNAARRDSVEFVRAEALAAAADVLGPRAALDTLVAALAAPSARTRTAAATALAALPTAGAARDRAGTALAGALSDADFAVAATAAEALGTLGGTAHLAALAAAYDARGATRTDLDVRLAAVQAAGELAAGADAAARAAAAALFERAARDADSRIAHAAAVGQARWRGAAEPPAAAVRAADTPVAFDSLPPVDLGRVRVRLQTAGGEAVLELDGDDYPRTVANFLRLVDSGFYAGGVFHRVVPAFVVQGGCPRGDGWGDAGWSIPCEYGDLRYDAPGVVGMAHAGKDTGGSQFFITHLPVPRLDGRYTAFGRVVAGMETIDRIVRGDRFRIVRDTQGPVSARRPDPLTSGSRRRPRRRARRRS